MYIAETLRVQYSELTSTLDARVVAANMYQRNALTLRELQSIQSRRDRPVEASETLLNIIIEQPDAVFLCFLDVLKCSEQQHIYRRLVEQGYRGRKHVAFCTALQLLILLYVRYRTCSFVSCVLGLS